MTYDPSFFPRNEENAIFAIGFALIFILFDQILLSYPEYIA